MMADSIRKDWPDFARRSAEALFHARPSDATLSWLAALFSSTELPVALEALSVLSAYTPEEAVARVRAPQLFIHAANDRVAPVSVGKACVNAASDGELVVFERGGHFIPVECKDALHETIRSFVQTLKKRGH
jgi:pimeloyl-ACP methyl ester carboxylesterase